MGVPMFLVKLMDRPKLGKVKLGPEDLICIDFANRLRAYTLDGRLSAVWCHIGNEIGGGHGRSSQIAYSIGKALGVISGFPDYVFLWRGGCGLLEFKSGTGTLSENQRWFKAWSELSSLPYEVVRSADDGEAILRRWGVLA